MHFGVVDHIRASALTTADRRLIKQPSPKPSPKPTPLSSAMSRPKLRGGLA
jgi:hypothetical protein